MGTVPMFKALQDQSQWRGQHLLPWGQLEREVDREGVRLWKGQGTKGLGLLLPGTSQISGSQSF